MLDPYHIQQNIVDSPTCLAQHTAHRTPHANTMASTTPQERTSHEPPPPYSAHEASASASAEGLPPYTLSPSTPLPECTSSRHISSNSQSTSMLGQEALVLAVIEEAQYQQFLERQQARVRALRIKADQLQRMVDSERRERGQDRLLIMGRYKYRPKLRSKRKTRSLIYEAKSGMHKTIHSFDRFINVPTQQVISVTGSHKRPSKTVFIPPTSVSSFHLDNGICCGSSTTLRTRAQTGKLWRKSLDHRMKLLRRGLSMSKTDLLRIRHRCFRRCLEDSSRVVHSVGIQILQRNPHLSWRRRSRASLAIS